MAKDDESKTPGGAEKPVAEQGKAGEAPARPAEALKEKTKSASKVRSSAERVRRNPFR